MIDKFETITIGQTAELIHQITAQDVHRFVEMTGDDNPLHLDAAYAEQTKFHDVVAHGMLGASFVSTIIGKYLPGPGALWLSQSFEFVSPARIGDVLTVRAEVTDKIPSQRLLDLAVSVINQDGQDLIRGEGRVQLLETKKEAAWQPPKVMPVAIVTGGSRGIGAAVCAKLAADGFSVVVNFRSDEKGAESVVNSIVKSGGSAIACQSDVCDEEAIQRLVSEANRCFGTVTTLVNNATGKLPLSTFEQTTEKDFQAAMRMNLYAPLAMTRAVLPDFRLAGKGSVINIGSVTADSAPSKNMCAYTTAKGAITTATRCLAVEYGHENIRFNLVSPGFTNTRLVTDLSERSRLLTKAQTPLGRLAEPGQIAAAVAFLASDDASHITGETIRVNGGLIMV